MNLNRAADAAGTMKQTSKENQTVKTLTQLALAAVLLATAVAARAETVRGHFRSNGTYVAPYYRTPANGTPYDNLSYRGYPSQQPRYVSSRSSSFDSEMSRPKTMPYYGTKFATGLLPDIRDYSPKPLHRRYSS